MAAKPPVFQFGGVTEDVTDPKMTFEQLRVAKKDDFPELEDGKRVSWTVEYGKVTKTVPKPKDTAIHTMKAEIEQSESFLDMLKKSKEKDFTCKVRPHIAAQNELAFAGLSMPHVKISLYDLIKTTGELKNAFRFQYNGRDYRRLSHSEKLKAGLEVSEMMKRLTGRRYPVFIDDVESITRLPKLPDQILLARVVPDQPLSVVIPGKVLPTSPAPLKKAS